MASARVSQLSERLCFDLTDALTRNRKILAYFFESVLASVLQSEAHLDDLLFARAQRL